MKQRTAVVTGAAGFAGYNLVERLVEKDFSIYAVVRPHSAHNARLNGLAGVQVVDLDVRQLHILPSLIPQPCDVFFHLTWMHGGRDDLTAQQANIPHVIAAVEAAAVLSCKRIVLSGSQAEYGLPGAVMTEDLLPNPINAYGSAKVAACYLSKRRAAQLNIDWIWGRIFSLYGKYEPAGRMLPDLIDTLKSGKTPHLSSCTQYWDFLDAGDGANALIALAESGKSGEIYNIANGNYKPLKVFTEAVRERIAPDITIDYGKQAAPFVELRPSVEKIKRDTGWQAEISF